MADGRGPRFRDCVRVARQAGILDEPAVRRLLRYAAAADTAAVYREVMRVLRAAAADHIDHPFHGPRDADGVRLGVTPDGGPVALTERDVNRHVLVVGRTGAGKTTLFYNVMDQLDVPFWAFDLKRDYRHLLPGHDVAVLPWQRLLVNPLRPPPGVSWRRWMQVFADVFGHATSLLSGSKNYLLQRLAEVYDGVDGWPTVADLRRAVQEDDVNYTRKTSNYRDTVGNRLDALLLTTDDLFTASRGVDLAELLERDVVFEFDGLGRDAQNFVMEVLFAWVFEYRLAQGHRGEGLRHVFFLDEGKRVFSVYKERQDAAGLPEVDDMTAKMREFGEGLVVADQEPGKLTESVKANTRVKVVLPLGDDTQLGEMRRTLGLSERQARVARRLGTGEALVQVGGSRVSFVELDDYGVAKSVDDDSLQEYMDPVWSSLLRGGEPGETAETRGERPEERGEAGEPDVGDDVADLLRDVVRRPFASLSDRYELFSSTGKAYNVKQRAVDRGLVREREVETGGGTRLKLLELTEDARRYLERRGVDVERVGRGGVVHRYWQHRFRSVFAEQGVDAGVEVDGADVAASVDGVRVAVEVAMRAADREVEHAVDRLDGGFDRVVFACRSDAVAAELEAMLADAGVDMDRVLVLGFQDAAAAVRRLSG